MLGQSEIGLFEAVGAGKAEEVRQQMIDGYLHQFDQQFAFSRSPNCI